MLGSIRVGAFALRHKSFPEFVDYLKRTGRIHSFPIGTNLCDDDASGVLKDFVRDIRAYALEVKKQTEQQRL